MSRLLCQIFLGFLTEFAIVPLGQDTAVEENLFGDCDNYLQVLDFHKRGGTNGRGYILHTISVSFNSRGPVGIISLTTI